MNNLTSFGTVSIHEIANAFDPMKGVKASIDLHGRPLKDYFDGGQDLVVLLNGEIVEDMDTIVAKHSSIILTPYVSGGAIGKVLAVVATIAIAIVAPMAATAMVNAIGATTALGYAAATAIYYGTMAAVMIGGSMLVNSVLAPDAITAGTASLGRAGTQESPTYSWNGIKTSTGQNGPIPVVYGTAWVGGQVINKFITYDGTDEYLYVQLALCQGEIYDIDDSDILINSTPFINYAVENPDAEVPVVTASKQVVTGTYNQPIMDGFGHSTYSNNIQLLVTEEGGGLVRQTASTSINRLSIHIAFQGLVNVNDSGKNTNRTVQFQLQYREVGDQDWLPFVAEENSTPSVDIRWKVEGIMAVDGEVRSHYFTDKPDAEQWLDDNGLYFSSSSITAVTITPDGGTEVTASEDGIFSMTGATRNPLKKRYTTFSIPKGQYEVKVTRITADTTSTRISDKMYFSILDEIDTADTNYGGIAVLGIRLKATNQLSSEPNFKVRVRRKSSVIEGTTYETNYPPYAILDMLTNKHYGAGLPVSRVDIDAFNDWGNFCKLDYGQDTVISGEAALHDLQVLYRPDLALPEITTLIATVPVAALGENITAYNPFTVFNISCGVTTDTGYVRTLSFSVEDVSAVGYYTGDDGVPTIQVYFNKLQILAGSAFSWDREDLLDITFNAALPSEEYFNENLLQFNGVLDTQSSLWDSMQRVAKVGRGQVLIRGTQYGCMVDKPTPPTQLFNDSNILNDSFAVNYLGVEDIATEVEVQYADGELRGEMNQISVIDRAMHSSQLTPKKATVQLLGCTKRVQALAFGRYLIAQGKYIKRTVTFDADIDAIACTVGDVIGVANSIPEWGIGGRITEVGSTILVDNDVTFEQAVLDDPDHKYVIRYRDSFTDAINVMDVLNPAGTGNEIQVAAVGDAKVDDVYTIGVQSANSTLDDMMLYRVIDISRGMDQSRAITALEYNESILDVDYDNDLIQQAIPLAKPQVTVSNLEVAEDLIKLQDGTIVTRVSVSWVSDATEPTTYQVGYKLNVPGSITTTTIVGTTNTTSYLFDYPDSLQESADIIVYLDTQPKETTTLQKEVTLVGKSLPPEDPTNLVASPFQGSISLTWDASVEIDFKHTLIDWRVSGESGWSRAGQTIDNGFVIPNVDKGTYDIQVTHVDTVGLSSVPSQVESLVTANSIRDDIRASRGIEQALANGEMVIFLPDADKSAATAWDLWRVSVADLTLDELSWHSSHVEDLSFDDMLDGFTYRYLDTAGIWQLCALDQLVVIDRLLGFVTPAALADGNVKIFTTQPVPPYSVGDLWLDGGTIKVCNSTQLT